MSSGATAGLRPEQRRRVAGGGAALAPVALGRVVLGKGVQAGANWMLAPQWGGQRRWQLLAAPGARGTSAQRRSAVLLGSLLVAIDGPSVESDRPARNGNQNLTSTDSPA